MVISASIDRGSSVCTLLVSCTCPALFGRLLLFLSAPVRASLSSGRPFRPPLSGFPSPFQLPRPRASLSFRLFSLASPLPLAFLRFRPLLVQLP